MMPSGIPAMILFVSSFITFFEGVQRQSAAEIIVGGFLFYKLLKD